MDALTKVASFLMEYSDVLGDIINAVEAGMSKDAIKKAVKDAMIAASDAEMRRELE